jgi:hypothetical protein
MVHLNEFYPNWRWLDEKISENMRNWLGSTVLEFLINKSIAEWAKAMFVFSGKISMQSFLIKHGFTEAWKYQYIKIL